MQTTHSNLHMSVKRQVRTKARSKRRLRAIAWRLGVTPELLKAALNRHKRQHQ